MVGGAFDCDKLLEKSKKLESEISDPTVWENREKANKIAKEIKRIKETVRPWGELKKEVDNLYELYTLALDEKEEGLESEISDSIKDLKSRVKKLEKLSLFRRENDESNAYLTIHSGAGGTEACDWVSMLLRMYLKWADNNNFKADIVDILEGEEAGIKVVTVWVKGSHAYGYLKNEIGIHRLVRISPFDSNSRRHTSFASVFCMPEIDDSIVIDMDPKDMKIDTYRSQGAGGQHVNKTDSAVRITHIPTGIVAQCQNERSQFKNKSMAIKILKAKIYDHLKKEKDKEKQELERNKKNISWGNQIRSYVFQPYTLVKDLRTGLETGNVEAVLNGDINIFIETALKMNV